VEARGLDLLAGCFGEITGEDETVKDALNVVSNLEK
jgi:hypothetical protein